MASDNLNLSISGPGLSHLFDSFVKNLQIPPTICRTMVGSGKTQPPRSAMPP